MVHSSRHMLVKKKHCTFSRLRFVGMYCCFKTTLTQFQYISNTKIPVLVLLIYDSEPDCLKVPVHLTPVSVQLIRNQFAREYMAR